MALEREPGSEGEAVRVGRRRIASATGFAVVALAVASVYTFFASYGTFQFRTNSDAVFGNRPGDGYYGALAAGFLRGQLNVVTHVDPKLAALPYPYDYDARNAAGIPYMWDASYLNGKYYLYFSPLPALLFYIPVKVLYGGYPPDQLAAAFFATWAFLMAAAFVRRALALSGRRPAVPLTLWLLMLAFATLVPAVMVYSRAYEVASLCAMAMTSTWAWSLLRFVEAPRMSRLVFMSTWLALAIAARPNLGLLLPVFFLAVWRTRSAAEANGTTARAIPPWRVPIRMAVAALAPLAVVALALFAYNYARFRDPLEFGIRYQLTYMPMEKHRVCSCRTPREALRLLNTAAIYVGAPLQVSGDFPFVSLTDEALDPAISFAARTEPLAGLLGVVPLALLGSVVAAVLGSRRVAKDAGLRAGLLVTLGGWLVLIGLSTCWFAVARYELDFTMLITMGAVVCLEAGLRMLADEGAALRALRIAVIVIALLSTAAGIFLGFSGPHRAFEQANPPVYERVRSFFR